jgi:hypothetical protein
MTPDKMEFKVGETVHGQPLRLVFERELGREVWSLHMDAANQRDDPAVIRGLPAEAIHRMALAVGSRPKD